jgi:DNA-binding response OmpR family regulator
VRGQAEGTMARKRVLIVKDDPDFRAMIRGYLEAAGYEPSEAGDGTEGLAKAEALRPDVILLDVRMPGITGFEVCQGLKATQETKRIPVIFLTAVDDFALNRLAYQSGAVACLTKPFRREALLAVIDAALTSAERQSKPKKKGGAIGH